MGELAKVLREEAEIERLLGEILDRPLTSGFMGDVEIDPGEGTCPECEERTSRRNPFVSIRSAHFGCLRCLARRIGHESVAGILLSAILRHLGHDDTGFE